MERRKSCGKDLRYALRSLRQSPTFTAVVVLTLGLGLGANIALFSVARSVVLRPLPYGEPERVVSIWSQWEGFPKTWVSIPEYRQYRDTFESFDDVGLYFDTSGNLTDGDDPERVGLSRATSNVFDVLGVNPVLGRTFTRDEAKAETANVVVVSHELWMRRYGGSSEFVGDRIELDGVPRTVVGVLPAGFRLPIDFGRELVFDVYVPMDVPDGTVAIPRNGGSHSYYGVARLADGVTVEKAEAEALAWNQRSAADGLYEPSRQFRALVIPVADDVVGGARTAIWILVARAAALQANASGAGWSRSSSRSLSCWSRRPAS